MNDQIVDILLRSRRVAVLTGAGISAESGVPTFRGKEGLWGKFRPEELATMEAFMSNPKIVWEWYNWRRSLIGEVKPNPGHLALAELETMIEQFTLITQNVDGLHQQAGSRNILELHGNIMRNKCLKCGKNAPEEVDIDPHNIPACRDCGGKLRPDVVWFGEMLDQDIIAGAFKAAETCDIFFSIGTSALVHPAASLPAAAIQRGATLVEINPDRTPLTDYADFYVASASGEYLPRLMQDLQKRTNS